MYALQTKNLSKVFGGVHAVDHLSISFEGGKITGVVGPNGSGKTTLTNVLTGVHAIDGGAVIIGGDKELEKIASHEVFSLGISRTFQNVRLFGQMSVLDNLLLALTKRDILGAFFEKHSRFHLGQAEETLKRVGLWEKRNEHAENLSYGQRKLLEIARALATGAETLFFDEPFAVLFPEMEAYLRHYERTARGRPDGHSHRTRHGDYPGTLRPCHRAGRWQTSCGRKTG